MNSFQKFSSVALSIILGVGYCGMVSAAGPDENEGVKDRKRESYEPKGINLGGFQLYPKVTLTAAYDDNIYKANTNPDHDIITVLTPSVSLKSDWSVHSLSLDASVDAGRYADRGADDYEDIKLSANGRIDVSRAMNIAINGAIQNLHEDRGGDDVATNAANPVEYSLQKLGAVATYKPNRLGVAVGFKLDSYDYDDNLTIGGATTNNDDRDRDESELSLRLGYDIQDGYEGYFSIKSIDRDYDLALDDGGVNRDSEGRRYAAGVAVALTRLIRADVSLGWMEQDYDSAALQDVDDWLGNADVRWNVTPLTTMRFTLSRSIGETTTAGTSATLGTNYGIGVDHEFLRNLVAKADYRLSNSDFRGDPTGREDDTGTWELGVDYTLNRNVFAGFTYTNEERDSNISGNDYDRNKVLLKVGARF